MRRLADRAAAIQIGKMPDERSNRPSYAYPSWKDDEPDPEAKERLAAWEKAYQEALARGLTGAKARIEGAKSYADAKRAQAEVPMDPEAEAYEAALAERWARGKRGKAGTPKEIGGDMDHRAVTVEHVLSRVDAIEQYVNQYGDDGMARQWERALWGDVLAAIEAGTTEAQALASAALRIRQFLPGPGDPTVPSA